MNKISYIRSSVASPKEINLDYVKEFIMKNEYILNKNQCGDSVVVKLFIFV
jgi:hypothetical protein